MSPSVTPLVYVGPNMPNNVSGAGSRAEWVALMALIAERDREQYRELRREAWESVEARPADRSCSEKSN